jgi:hypothetical protein
MMILRTAIISAMALWFSASLLVADEVLHCTDTAVTGFKWDNAGKANLMKFDAFRFTVKVISDIRRAITRTVGDNVGISHTYACVRIPFRRESQDDQIICNRVNGQDQWIFYKNNYTHAFLAGPSVGPPNLMDQNIWIAYGTCARF